jgi:hypothetical protein
MSDNNWYSPIYKACIVASMITFIIGFFTPLTISTGAYITGYSVLTLGIMMILVVLFYNVLKESKEGYAFSNIPEIMVVSGPFLLILGTIAFVSYLLLNFKDIITSGRVAPAFKTYSNLIVILVLLQNYLIYRNIGTSSFDSSGKLSGVTNNLLYLIGILSLISAIILYRILKYYSTDGFSYIN